jgi:hypothetical protein
MKKFFLLSFLLASLVSCTPDDSGANFHTEIVPIANVTIPEEFQFGQVYEIGVTYFKPNSCHVFNNFYYDINQNERTIAVITTVYEDSSCETFDQFQEENEVEVSFNFQVNSADTYTFKFYQGDDENGNDLYYIVEVPVVE